MKESRKQGISYDKYWRKNSKQDKNEFYLKRGGWDSQRDVLGGGRGQRNVTEVWQGEEGVSKKSIFSVTSFMDGLMVHHSIAYNLTQHIKI